MKLKCALIAVSLLLLGEQASAAVDPNFERHKRVTACKLGALEMTVLDAHWNKLAMRHFQASTEQGIDPVEAARIRREVDAGLAELRRQFGPSCVLDIY